MNKDLWRPLAVTALLVGAAALGGCNKNPDGAASPDVTSPATPPGPGSGSGMGNPGTGATPGSGSGGTGSSSQ
ncbi:hypothetical protein [Polaromonas sp.]|uniref:hypothetical protein n=1 Tax=Polaromonas sp. TaxID=1869339 RepID=UPI00326766C7